MSMTRYVLGVEKSCRDQAWVFRCQDEAKIDEISQRSGLDDLTATLLAGRGVGPDSVDDFLNPSLRNQMPDPSTMADMDKAARLIVDAVEAGRRITVFADYDVDGGTSAAQLIRWGRAFGASFGLYVPDRVKEGYGPSREAFEKLAADNVDVVITVDCGAAAHDALEGARDLDLDIIVVDHHLMHGEAPPCAALVNPNRPDDSSGLGHLAAAGVTFMLLAALNRETRKRGLGGEPNLMHYLGLAALGTVCDVVPLTGINRVLVAQGLKALGKENIAGLAALADVAGAQAPYTTYHAGFVLGPRLNAGGRIGEADMGAKLLSTEDTQAAYKFAAELDRVNSERKAMQDDILREALDAAGARRVGKSVDIPVDNLGGENGDNSEDKQRNSYGDNGVIVSSMHGWHPGIIGIVAGRLKDRFGQPSIVIGVDEDGIGKGSGRSIKGVNLGDAIVAAKEAGLIEAGGGHAMAAGLTVKADKIADLEAFLNAQLSDDIAAARQEMALKIDGLIAPSAATRSLTDMMDSVGPYGAGNPEPLFALPDMRISYAERVRGGHVRCSFENSAGIRISGICIPADETGLAEVLLAPNPGNVHVAGRIKRNDWKGRTKIDIQVTDLAPA